ncbi:MAG: chemotaxis protein CheX [Thermodesulfobacteriota bacterium]|nr:chemotaxis protein CheX [Thermodesulfobacteriota bacterium]
MDVRFINPFLKATANVIKTMALVDLSSEPPFLKKDHTALGDVSGIIGLTGDAKGSLSVTLNFSLTKIVMENMLGDVIEDVTAEAQDAVGELTNMISGDARRMLQQEGINLTAAIPSIVAGKDHTITHFVTGPTIVIPFKCEGGGKASIEISIQSSKQNIL